MSLSSVAQTAMSGISAAQSMMGVIANNLANAQTPGFKASKPSLATQSPQTASLGAAPTAGSGGSNPVQVGNGVRVAGISADFTQGSVAIDSNPLSLALQGDGMFSLEGFQGEHLYSRDGQFSLNANKELVSTSGHRALGYAADDNFQVQQTDLTTLQIPIGKQIAGAGGQTATLTTFSVNGDGTISGRFSDGVSRDLGMIAVARFANPVGLQQQGANTFATGPNSGLPVESSPGTGAAASITAGAVELSNVDVGENLIGMSQASNLFRANMAVLETTDELLDELIHLGR